MALAMKVEGKLIGYSTYSKDGETTHTYAVLIQSRPDSVTKLYKNYALAEIREKNAVIAEPQYGMKVTCYAEQRGGKDGSSYLTYSEIEAAK